MRTVGVGHFCCKINGSGSNLFKNEWDWVVFAETGWEWVVFHQKWLGRGRFCQKCVGVGESSWEWVRVAGSW